MTQREFCVCFVLGVLGAGVAAVGMREKDDNLKVDDGNLPPSTKTFQRKVASWSDLQTAKSIPKQYKFFMKQTH